MSDLVFIDTETTSLRPDRRVWEVGLITRMIDAPDLEVRFMIRFEDLELGNADLFSLKVGRFHERHPEAGAPMPAEGIRVISEADAMAEVEHLTRGAHLVGTVVSFDADVLGQRMRSNGICPSWHYHLVDVEAMAAGWIYGNARSYGTQGPLETPAPPWNSEELSRAMGVDPSGFDRHTALGDARWARAIYDKLTGSKPVTPKSDPDPTAGPADLWGPRRCLVCGSRSREDRREGCQGSWHDGPGSAEHGGYLGGGQ